MTKHTKLAYSIGELSDLVCLGRTKIYGEMRRGRLVAHKMGARTVFLPADVDRWLNALPKHKPSESAE